MINGLSEIDIFKVVRPVIDGCELDSHDFPIIQAPTLDSIDWENIYPIIKIFHQRTIIPMLSL